MLNMASRFSCGGKNSEVEDYLKETAIRKQIGGKVVFVEYERDKERLLKFYQDNGFEEFKVPSDEDAKGRLGQLFYFLPNDSVQQSQTGGLGS